MRMSILAAIFILGTSQGGLPKQFEPVWAYHTGVDKKVQILNIGTGWHKGQYYVEFCYIRGGEIFESQSWVSEEWLKELKDD